MSKTLFNSHSHSRNLGSALLCTTNDDLPFYFYNVFECEYLRNGNIVLLFMLLCKCDHICGTLLIDFFGFSSNVILVTYAIVKSLQDELSSCCITFAYEYNNLFTFMMLVNNWMVSFGNIFIVDLFESYIV
jgi:hypothetical protein